MVSSDVGNNDKTHTDSLRISSPEERLSFGIKANQSFIEAATHSLDVAFGHLGIQRSAHELLSNAANVKENSKSETDFLKKIQQTLANNSNSKLIEDAYLKKLLEVIFLPFSQREDLADFKGGSEETYLVNMLSNAFEAVGISHHTKNSPWIYGG